MVPRFKGQTHLQTSLRTYRSFGEKSWGVWGEEMVVSCRLLCVCTAR